MWKQISLWSSALILCSTLAFAQFPYLEQFDGPLDPARWQGASVGTGRQHETIRYPIGGHLYLGQRVTQGGDWRQQVRLQGAQSTTLLALAMTVASADLTHCDGDPSVMHGGLVMSLFHIAPFDYGVGVFLEAGETGQPLQALGVIWQGNGEDIVVLHEVPLGAVALGEMAILGAHWLPGVQVAFYLNEGVPQQVVPFAFTGEPRGGRLIEIRTTAGVCAGGAANGLISVDAVLAQ